MVRIVGAALLCLTFVGCASSPKEPHMTLGDLKAKGATKLTGPEVRTLMSGSTMSGAAWSSGVPFTSTMAPNGTFDGITDRGRSFSGTWTVSESGESCTYIRNAPPGGTPCAFTYELDGKYYIADKDEASSRVLERKFAR